MSRKIFIMLHLISVCTYYTASERPEKKQRRAEAIALQESSRTYSLNCVAHFRTEELQRLNVGPIAFATMLDNGMVIIEKGFFEKRESYILDPIKRTVERRSKQTDALDQLMLAQENREWVIVSDKETGEADLFKTAEKQPVRLRRMNPRTDKAWFKVCPLTNYVIGILASRKKDTLSGEPRGMIDTAAIFSAATGLLKWSIDIIMDPDDVSISPDQEEIIVCNDFGGGAKKICQMFYKDKVKIIGNGRGSALLRYSITTGELISCAILPEAPRFLSVTEFFLTGFDPKGACLCYKNQDNETDSVGLMLIDREGNASDIHTDEPPTSDPLLHRMTTRTSKNQSWLLHTSPPLPATDYFDKTYKTYHEDLYIFRVQQKIVTEK